jgi:hypothetical protein
VLDVAGENPTLSWAGIGRTFGIGRTRLIRMAATAIDRARLIRIVAMAIVRVCYLFCSFLPPYL